MFPLPRPARSIAVTLLLVLLTVVPTFGGLAFIWKVKQPGHLRDMETELGQALGLHATLTSVRHPRPGTDEFTGVILRREQSTGGSRLVELVRADRLTVEREKDRVIMRAEGLQLQGENPGEVADEWLALSRSLAGKGRAELIAPKVLVKFRGGDRESELSVHDLAAVASSKGLDFELSTSYRFGASDQEGSRCELRLAQRGSAGQPRTELSFQTMDGDLPISVLGPLLDGAAWFGPEARIRGELTAFWGPRTPETLEFEGEISKVSLQQLVERHFPGRRLRGLARLQIESAVWSDLPGTQGRGWTSAQGQIQTGAGSIGPEFVAGLLDELRFRPARTMNNSDEIDMVAFESLGLGFSLNHQGELRLSGGLGGSHAEDVVLTGGQPEAPLLRQPEGVASVRGLWKTLLPWDDDVLVPATVESHVLRHLPLPQLLSQPQRSLPAN